jgi:uncharacterized protein (DUF1015 family)
MAEIRPFRALEYDAGRVSIGKVVTQPYDKITPAMRERYLAADPKNIVRILRPLDDPARGMGSAPYERAAQAWKLWRQEGIVRQLDRPVLFAYYQSFSLPGQLRTVTRKGFIGLTRLEAYGRGVIFPHERTLSGPRQDRLELLRHTRTHFGQVFLMYSDPGARVDALLDRVVSGREALEVRDEYEVDHRLWAIDDPGTISDIISQISDKRLVIADGHHRYETALAFRDEERVRSGGGDAGPFEWLMTTLVNMDSPGMVVLPTHRVLARVEGFDPGFLLRRVRDFYDIVESPDAETLLTKLAESGLSRSSLGLVLADRVHRLLVLRPGVDAHAILGDVSPAQARLDVVLLHRLVLERCLGLTEEAIRRESHLRYLRDPREAMAEVEGGAADACFLLNPTPLEAVREIAFGGEVLPQKSTDFFPKLLSGLVMYSGD